MCLNTHNTHWQVCKRHSIFAFPFAACMVQTATCPGKPSRAKSDAPSNVALFVPVDAHSNLARPSAHTSYYALADAFALFYWRLHWQHFFTFSTLRCSRSPCPCAAPLFVRLPRRLAPGCARDARRSASHDVGLDSVHPCYPPAGLYKADCQGHVWHFGWPPKRCSCQATRARVFDTAARSTTARIATEGLRLSPGLCAHKSPTSSACAVLAAGPRTPQQTLHSSRRTPGSAGIWSAGVRLVLALVAFALPLPDMGAPPLHCPLAPARAPPRRKHLWSHLPLADTWASQYTCRGCLR